MTERDHGNLEQLAAAVDAGADRLRNYLDEFEGGIDENGEMVVGVRALYEKAVADHAEAVFAEYEKKGERPPSEAIRETRARQIVEREDAILATRYAALRASIKVGEKWLTQKRAAISALQTLHKTERDLAGVR